MRVWGTPVQTCAVLARSLRTIFCWWQLPALSQPSQEGSGSDGLNLGKILNLRAAEGTREEEEEGEDDDNDHHEEEVCVRMFLALGAGRWLEHPCQLVGGSLGVTRVGVHQGWAARGPPPALSLAVTGTAAAGRQDCPISTLLRIRSWLLLRVCISPGLGWSRGEAAGPAHSVPSSSGSQYLRACSALMRGCSLNWLMQPGPAQTKMLEGPYTGDLLQNVLLHPPRGWGCLGSISEGGLHPTGTRPASSPGAKQ